MRTDASHAVSFVFVFARMYTDDSQCGGFPELGVPFLGVPIIRNIVFRGLHLGPPILGNHRVPFLPSCSECPRD